MFIIETVVGDDEQSGGVPTAIDDTGGGAFSSQPSHSQADVSSGIPQAINDPSVSSPFNSRRRSGSPTQQLPPSYKSPGILRTSPTLNVDKGDPAAVAQHQEPSTIPPLRVRQNSPTRPMPWKTAQGVAAPPTAAQAVHPFAKEDEPVQPASESRLGEMFGLNKEMARPKGAFGAPMRAVINWAAQQHGEFTAHDMLPVYQAAGGQRDQTNKYAAYQSFTTALKRIIAPEGRRPSDEQPLVVAKVGTKGRGGAATYKWAAKNRPALASPAPTPTKPSSDVPAGEFDDEPTAQDAPAYKDPEPDLSDDGTGDDEDRSEPDEPDEQRPTGVPSWMPMPDADGTGAQYSMSVIADQEPKLGLTSPFWRDIARAAQNGDDGAAMQAVRSSGPQLTRHKLQVVRAIFQNLGKKTEI